jgi:hypothetical protein
MERIGSGGRGNVNGTGNGSRVPPSGITPREILPDLGTGRRTASRSGLDNHTTAFDMKSLGKHIEAVSLPVDARNDELIESSRPRISHSS